MPSLKIDLPLIPLRDVVVFPGFVTTLFVGREKSIEALNNSMVSGKKIVLSAQKDSSREDPSFDEIYEHATICNLLQLIKLPDGTMKVLVEGTKRCLINKITVSNNYLKASVTEYSEDKINKELLSKSLRIVKAKFEEYISITKRIPPEIVSTVDALDDLSRLLDTITGHLAVDVSKKQEILEISNRESYFTYGFSTRCYWS